MYKNNFKGANIHNSIIGNSGNAQINLSYSSSQQSIDWAAAKKELEQLKELTDLKSIHTIIDETSATVDAKNYSKLVSVLKKMGEVGLNILGTTSLVIIPEIVRKAIGLG